MSECKLEGRKDGREAHPLDLAVEHEDVEERLDVLDSQLRLRDAALAQEALDLRRGRVLWRRGDREERLVVRGGGVGVFLLWGALERLVMRV